MSITSSTTIAAGSTVLIAAGATINLSAGANIVVSGTLAASSQCGSHAKLMWATGTGATTGIIVAGGGKLLLDGVDITNAGQPILVQGNGTAEYDNGTITNPTTAFNVSGSGSLTTIGATVTGTRGNSVINGPFTAKNLNYDASTNQGFQTGNSATVDIENSVLHGNGNQNDMLISGEIDTVGSVMKVSHTEIYGIHCAFHFAPVKSFDLSYINMHNNAFGFMLFGSSAASSMSFSDLDTTNAVPYSEINSNAAIAFDGNYIPVAATATTVTITNPSTMPVAGAGPQ